MFARAGPGPDPPPHDPVFTLTPAGQPFWNRTLSLQTLPFIPTGKMDPVENHADVALKFRPEVNEAKLQIQSGDLAVANAQTVAFFSEIRADVALLGSGCVAADEGVTDFYVDEIATRRVMIANTATTYVLADASKLGKVAPHHVCGLDDVSSIITDQPPPDHPEGIQ